MAFDYDAMSNIAVSLATLTEFLDRFFQKKEDRETALTILLNANKKEMRKNKIVVEVKKIPQIKEIYAQWDIKGKKHYPSLPDKIEMTSEMLSIHLVKSVTSISPKLMERLQEKIRQLEFALHNVWWQEKWIDICLSELHDIYLKCIGVDRQMYDRQLVESTREMMRYIGNLNANLGLYTSKSNRFKEIGGEIIEQDFDEEIDNEYL
ncbi:MAG: hypothetical protein GF329_03070 [Candidatus Lokiarchaeota archaeon]|nr:hypothetical protein [Candidatus Lokiarchaeota archaeon]